MKEFSVQENRIKIKFNLPYFEFQQVLNLVRSLDGKHFNPSDKLWYADVNERNIEVLTNNGFKGDESVPKKVVVQTDPPHKKVDTSKLHNSLYPYQVRGVEFLEAVNGVGLILDDMGVGKTCQAISYLRLHPELDKILVVCPAFLKINWQREIVKWMGDPHVKCSIISGRNADIVNDDSIRFYIINYEILDKCVEKLMSLNVKCLIGDEIQYVFNHKALRTKAFVELARTIPKKIFLTGTMMKNRPAELFTGLNLIAPHAFPNRWRFLQTYCNPIMTRFGWEFKGISNSKDLYEKMRPYYIRRMKKDVLPELPQKRRIIVPFEMDNSSHKRYDGASERFQEWADNNEKKKSEGKVFVETLRQIAYAGKRDFAINWIKDFLEDEDKLVVYAYHKEAINDLQEAFKGRCVTVEGDTPMAKRQEMVDRFQNDPSVELFIGQIQAAGTGITLTASSNVAFLEFPWSPAEVLQAEDRILRIGQKSDKVTVWYLIAANTIDEDMADTIDSKADMISQVFDGTNSDPFFGKSIVEIILERMGHK